MRLTAKERILIHLADFAKYEGVAEVPPEMGQEGIANSAGLHVQHVRQFIDPLIKEGLARERLAHVRSHRRRLKVYDLTESGRFAAARLRDQVRSEKVRVRDERGVHDTTIGELLKETKGSLALSVVVRSTLEGETLDLSALPTASTGGFMERLSELPRVERFVGRQAELEALTTAGPPFIVVRGVAGIGKSSLAAMACERLRGTRNLYWHRIRSWDTRLSILASLADFLSMIGRPGLRAVLTRGEVETADRVVREDLPGTESVLVFDDAHDASEEVLNLLGFLKDVVAGAPGVRAILLSRRAVPVYDRRDVTLHHVVQEIDLQGFAAHEIESFLAKEPAGAQLARMARRLGGHPLFLELLRSSTHDGVSSDSVKDVRRFVEEEIYADLSEPERRMMKTAALYAVPFPRDVLFGDPSMSHDVLLSLLAKSLVRPVAMDTFGVHDTIRDFFASILTPHEREALGSVASDHLVRLSREATASKDFVGALNCLSNALELSSSGHQQGALYEELGDADERLGDFPDALSSYKEAIRRTEDREALARLHRKVAGGLQIRGQLAPAKAEIEAGFAALGETPSGERGWLNFVQCRVALAQEEWVEAREYGEAALTAFESAGDPSGQARTKLELANVLINAQGDPAEAEGWLMSALDLSDAVPEPDFRPRVLILLANLYANRLGDVDRAAHHIAALEASQDSITDVHVRRSLLFLLGWFALFQRGDVRTAEARFTEALVLSRRIHAASSLTFAKLGLAHVAYYDGRIEEARDAFRRCAVEIDAHGFLGFAIEARWMVAECCLRLEDLPGFLQIVEEFRDPRLSTAVSARPFHAHVLEGLGQLILRDRVSCEDHFAIACRLLESPGRAPEAAVEAFVHWFYGVALRAMNEKRAAEELQRGRARLIEAGLRGQLALADRSEAPLVDFLRRTFTSGASTVAL